MNTQQAEHTRLINVACQRDGWHHGNWRAAFRKAVSGNAEWHGEFVDAEIDAYALKGHRLIPDAYRLVTEDWGYPVLVIEFLEVVVTNAMNTQKREVYTDLWWFFDDLSFFAFRVHLMDEFGVIRPYLDEKIMEANGCI